MHPEEQRDAASPFGSMPKWPLGAADTSPVGESRASKFWSWWSGKHLTPIQKTLLVVLVGPILVWMVVVKSQWDAENRAKAERDWAEHQERQKKLSDEIQHLEKEIERSRPVMEMALERARTKSTHE